MSLRTVFVSIGNSDDKLTQAEWCAFASEVRTVAEMYARAWHGTWTSEVLSAYQNATFCFEIHPAHAATAKARLRQVAERYRQDSIAWADAETEFLTPAANP